MPATESASACLSVAEEQDIEVFTVGLRVVQEPLKDGVGGISFLGRAHVTASR